MSLSEFELIERFFKRPAGRAVLGIGDDAALFGATAGCEIAITTDMLVEGRHFLPGAEPEALGHKTLAVNLSDLAAMGARPRWALLACALPEADPAWLEAFTRGFFALADAHGVELIGGDTTRGPRNLCVTILGEVPAGQALLRSGAQPAESIYVSGRLGDAALAVAHRRGRIALTDDELALCDAALSRPTPRVALGQRLRGLATAAIDLSDGLTGDLGHIAEASEVGATVELAAVPRSPALDRRLAGPDRAIALECLLAGGDDYELCFTAPAAAAAKVQALAAETGIALTRIGAIAATPTFAVVDERGRPLAAPRAFDHFGA
ncbi:MAG TPA: thiamine-phosphate kinase [Casimicrobiaceae bacterium]|jgi:thiamine-monophosphate kinase|nr:thiamine-phosphate kinase [Casimicrobiaceae bacterium]